MDKRMLFGSVIITIVLSFFCIQNSFAGSGSAHWSYHGLTGPEHWGTLDLSYRMAKDGKQQSPIDIDFNYLYLSNLPDITINYSRANFELIHNGHTIKANLLKNLGNRGNEIRIDDKVFELKQFHFHTPSEHTINSSFYDMEMHLVHMAKDGELAVIGVMIEGDQKRGYFEFDDDQRRGYLEFDDDNNNNTLEKVLIQMPGHENEKVRLRDPVNVKQLLPEYKEAFRYDGSLTTPPCTEGVNWVVMYENITIDEKIVSSFRELFSGEHFPEGNRRPIQPLNDRIINWDIFIR